MNKKLIRLLLFFVILILTVGCEVEPYIEAVEEQPTVIDERIVDWELNLETPINFFLEDSVNKVLYITSEDGKLYSINYSTGEILDSKYYEQFNNCGMLLRQNDKYLVAYNLDSCYLIKKSTLEIERYFDFDFNYLFDLKVDEKNIVLVYKGYTFKAFDIETLKEVWRFDESAIHIHQSVELFNGYVYIRGNKQFIVLDSKTGKEVARFDSQISYLFWNENDSLYGEGHGYVQKFNKKNNTFEWSTSIPEINLFLTEQGNLYGDDSKNAIIYRIDKSSGKVNSILHSNKEKIYSMADFGEKYLLVLFQNDKLVLYDKYNNNAIWEFDSQFTISDVRRIIYFDGNFIIPERNGIIRAFNVETILELYNNKESSANDESN